MEQQKEYRSIVKTTALFGGVQAFQVLLTLVRTKVVALLLGVDGVGLLGLLNNTISMVQSITGLGINQGGVKSISAAGNPQKAAQTASLVRQMSLYAGLFGSAVILTLSPWLSQWSFGNRDFTGANERRFAHLPRLPASPESGTSQFNRCIRRPVNLPTYILHMENRWHCSRHYPFLYLRLFRYFTIS